jgi:hypothetical protein
MIRGRFGTRRALALGMLGAKAHYWQRIKALYGANLVAHWPLWEPVGTTGAGSVKDIAGSDYNGTPTAITFGGTGMGDGRTSAAYDGSTSKLTVLSAELAAAFNGAAGTLMLWAKVSAAGVWTDGVFRRAFNFQVNAQNYIQILRGGNGQLYYYYSAGNVLESVTLGSLSTTDWMHLAITWDLAAGADGEVKAYYNGSQTGATQTSLGTWAGTIVAANIGSSTTDPTNVWSGSLAHAILLNRAATAAEVLKTVNP